MGIQRYIFFSIHNAERHPEVPLMQVKTCTEQYIQQSGLDYTIFRLCGFMQAIIGNYAVPVLEEKQVWRRCCALLAGSQGGRSAQQCR